MLLWLYQRIPRRWKNWYFERQLKEDMFRVFDARVSKSLWGYNDLLRWMEIGVRWSQYGIRPADAERMLQQRNPALFEKMQEDMKEKFR